jgi:predicted TIM-barrel fold metal-dependent hydrolase
MSNAVYPGLSRRDFLRASAVAAGALALPRWAGAAVNPAEPIIDMHGHVNYAGRTDDVFYEHQRRIGVTLTILLPSGVRSANHPGGSGENEAVRQVAAAHPGQFRFFSNEVTDHPEAPKVIEKHLKLGAIGIGEQKFRIDCDSPQSMRIAELAKEYNVPVILHFEHNLYNRHIERFHRVLERFPTVNFIGHAVAWWANIDKNAKQEDSYPTGPVTPGGITDRYLTEYPNCYADVSARSGYGAIIRDEAFYKDFLTRHQNKLLYGSDCSEGTGVVPTCFAAGTIAAIRRLAPSKAVERKILYENAKKLLKI